MKNTRVAGAFQRAMRVFFISYSGAESRSLSISFP